MSYRFLAKQKIPAAAGGQGIFRFTVCSGGVQLFKVRIKFRKISGHGFTLIYTDFNDSFERTDFKT
ncbi:hypothetical protein EDS67_28645 [candidate division KSB1 bacterium]|nr:MAG: hypothetical protein EDS67_28645 [candidate division KSB1 bacterium]MBC6950472.1 hypothetical protein [candidate division KSB1 bacterium]MCE7945359.1 hypothetical protein [Chlorobi bacterium CHB1]